MKLRRDPMCETLGCAKPATCVDHRRAFSTGKDEAERWTLFIGGTNFENLRSQCQEHHDAKPLAYEDGQIEHNPISPTCSAGRQFASLGSVTTEMIDRALADVNTPEKARAWLKENLPSEEEVTRAHNAAVDRRMAEFGKE
jgi:hypothetical protein